MVILQDFVKSTCLIQLRPKLPFLPLRRNQAENTETSYNNRDCIVVVYLLNAIFNAIL